MHLRVTGSGYLTDSLLLLSNIARGWLVHSRRRNSVPLTLLSDCSYLNDGADLPSLLRHV